MNFEVSNFDPFDIQTIILQTVLLTLYSLYQVLCRVINRYSLSCIPDKYTRETCNQQYLHSFTYNLDIFLLSSGVKSTPPIAPSANINISSREDIPFDGRNPINPINAVRTTHQP